jgi:hypothetical protein
VLGANDRIHSAIVNGPAILHWSTLNVCAMTASDVVQGRSLEDLLQPTHDATACTIG